MRAAWPSVSSGVVPRRPDCGCASRPLAARATGATGPPSRIFFMAASHPLDLHGAFLKIGLQRNRIGGVERHLVDQLRLVEPRSEEHTSELKSRFGISH